MNTQNIEKAKMLELATVSAKLITKYTQQNGVNKSDLLHAWDNGFDGVKCVKFALDTIVKLTDMGLSLDSIDSALDNLAA